MQKPWMDARARRQSKAAKGNNTEKGGRQKNQLVFKC